MLEHNIHVTFCQTVAGFLCWKLCHLLLSKSCVSNWRLLLKYSLSLCWHAYICRLQLQKLWLLHFAPLALANEWLKWKLSAPCFLLKLMLNVLLLSQWKIPLGTLDKTFILGFQCENFMCKLYVKLKRKYTQVATKNCFCHFKISAIAVYSCISELTLLLYLFNDPFWKLSWFIPVSCAWIMLQFFGALWVTFM